MNASQKHNPHLDGLRGIAILMVISFHFLPYFTIFNIGWTGVDLFFVLSGYLLTGRILPYISDKNIIRKFYRNRFLRIIPLYFLFLILFYLFTYVFTSTDTFKEFSNYRNNAAGVALFTTNWLLIQKQFPSAGYFGHLWSLAVEEQFYLFLPWFIIFIKNVKKLLIAGIIIIVVILFARNIYWFVFLKTHDVLNIYWNSILRVDSLFSGFLLYIITTYYKPVFLVKHIMFVIALCVIAILCGSAWHKTFRLNSFFITIGFTFINILSVSFIALLISPENNLLKKITKWNLLQYTGKISFGMYLLHWPLFLIGFSILNLLNTKLNQQLQGGTIIKLNIIMSVIFTYFLSSISFKYYESKFLKLKVKYK